MATTPLHLVHLRLAIETDRNNAIPSESVSYLGNFFPPQATVDASSANANLKEQGKAIKTHINDLARAEAQTWINHLNTLPERQPHHLTLAAIEVSLSWHPANATGTGSGAVTDMEGAAVVREMKLSRVPDGKVVEGVQKPFQTGNTKWMKLFAVVVDVVVDSWV
jgi:hypothetical protein